jgi:hypothetical protein
MSLRHCHQQSVVVSTRWLILVNNTNIIYLDQILRVMCYS